MVTSVQRRYPVRYWVTLAYLIGMPNFVHFDPTGLTHKYGLFNLSSISDIVFTAVAAAMLILLTLLSREGLLVRKIRLSAGIWLALLLSLTLATLLQPDPKLTEPKATDVIMSLYRLGQWILGFFLIVSLYSRASEEEAPHLLTQLVARMCWVSLAIIFVAAPIVPSLAYVSEDGTTGSVARLGGIMIHPSMIALMASAAFLHSMLLLRGPRRLAGCVLSFTALALTYTRSAQIVFVLAVMIYALFITRKRVVRWIGIACVIAALAGGAVAHNALQQYISRGQRQADVDSFGGRTETWEVGLKMFAQRPLLGYGYIAGPKNAYRDNWRATHWLPPHAHNDFVQALLSGGVITGALVVWLYLFTFWKGCRRARASTETTFFLLIFFQLLVTAMVSTNLTTGFGKPGVLFVTSFLVLVVEEKKKAGLALSRPAVLPATFRFAGPSNLAAATTNSAGIPLA